MNSSKRIVCQAVLAALPTLAATVALAQTAPALVGGGSSLAAPLIGAEISLFPAADGSASYASVGSGAGQAGFLNNDATQFGRTPGTTVDFAISEAPLTAYQISNYAASALGNLSTGGGPLIQIPYIVTPVTIPLVNAPAGTGPQTTTGQANSVALNDDDLCGIFSGKLNNWNQVTNPDTGAYYANGPITVVVDGGQSGTTDLLTRHLAAVCTNGGNSYINFTETQTFKVTLFPAGLPSNFVEANGDGGIVTALKNLGTAAGLSYLSPAYTNSFLATSSSAPAATNALPVASLRNVATGADVVPTYQNATLALGTVSLPTNMADQTQWVPNAANPTVGYPISGTSQIIVSQCYANHSNSPTVNASLVDFLNLHYNPAVNANNVAIIHGNGFDTVPANYAAPITILFLTTIRTERLNIGNATVCDAYAGR